MAKILIVDDESSIRELITAVLVAEGFEAKAVSSGQECLDVIKQEKPDLILLIARLRRFNQTTQTQPRRRQRRLISGGRIQPPRF